MRQSGAHVVRGGAPRRQVQCLWASLPSDAHRSRNEDALVLLPERGIFGVFDGMGGHRHADLAAQLAAQEVRNVLLPLAPDATDEAVADAIRDACFSADAVIRAEAPARGILEMGTTALVVVLRPEGSRPETWSAMVGWVGDSRAMVLPDGGRQLETLTLDDGVFRLHAVSTVQARRYQAALGQVTDARALSLRERDFFLERNVLTQAVGTSLQHVHLIKRKLGDGDQLVLITDGVHDNLTDLEMALLLSPRRGSADVAKRLVTAARLRSRSRGHLRAKPDDMTAVVVQLRLSHF